MLSLNLMTLQSPPCSWFQLVILFVCLPPLSGTCGHCTPPIYHLKISLFVTRSTSQNVETDVWCLLWRELWAWGYTFLTKRLRYELVAWSLKDVGIYQAGLSVTDAIELHYGKFRNFGAWIYQPLLFRCWPKSVSCKSSNFMEVQYWITGLNL